MGIDPRTPTNPTSAKRRAISLRRYLPRHSTVRFCQLWTARVSVHVATDTTLQLRGKSRARPKRFAATHFRDDLESAWRVVCFAVLQRPAKSTAQF
jgi:hypothetical protein